MIDDPERISVLLGLEQLPAEGGRFRHTHVDGHSSAIYYLLVAPEFSALHRLAATEVYHWHAGAPLRLLLLLLHRDGGVEEPVLGPDLGAGQRPQLVVPAGTWQGSSPDGTWSLVGTWQGSSPDGTWSLVGTTVAPAFRWSLFELGARADLVARYPVARARIESRTPRPACGDRSPGP